MIEKKSLFSPKFIRSYLQNDPNFRDLPPLGRRHKWMTSVYLFI